MKGIPVPVLTLALVIAGCGEEAVAPDTGGASAGPVSFVVVTGSVVNLRAGPGTVYEVVGTASRGDSLQVTGGLDDWYRIYDPSRSLFAWIHAGLTTGAELP